MATKIAFKLNVGRFIDMFFNIKKDVQVKIGWKKSPDPMESL